ncbi:MAG: hypothetical protein INR70_42495 [Parafilimonas terrae]|nr:hypothetical protein [Parafilimonas terrae]
MIVGAVVVHDRLCAAGFARHGCEVGLLSRASGAHRLLPRIGDDGDDGHPGAEALADRIARDPAAPILVSLPCPSLRDVKPVG